MNNVELYFESEVKPENILDFEFENVIFATGAKWKNNGQGRDTRNILKDDGTVQILTPDDLMKGVIPQGNVVLYDTDHYYMAGVLAEKCISYGCKTSYLSPANQVSEWTENTLEQQRIQSQLMLKGVQLQLAQSLVEIKDGKVFSRCIYTQELKYLNCDSIILVTERTPNDKVYKQLNADDFKYLALIGDAYTPGIIAQAVHSGHLHAQYFGQENVDFSKFKRDK
jgi:dimethylamine/trimethylamine dehydrogenase